MICDDAIEMLPWLLNGTLEEGERREVRRHLETCERCREALAGTREAWTIFGQHLPSETLVALAYGEVPEGIDPALAERHLASCPECSAELELARTSRRLEEDDKIALFPGRLVRKDRGESRSWRAAAVAASLVGVIAASGWIHSAQELRSVSEQVAERPPAPAVEPAPLRSSGEDPAIRRQVAEMEARVQDLQRKFDERTSQLEELQNQPRRTVEPRINVLPVTLSGPERSGDDEEVVVPADNDMIVTIDPQGPKTQRRIEVWGSAGKVFEKSGLFPSDDDFGQYSILFDSGFLKPGRYTLRLFENGKPTPTETYTLRVE